jgi:hypothetical protein
MLIFHDYVPSADCWTQMTSSNHVIWQEITCLLQNSPARFMLLAQYTGKTVRCSLGTCYHMPSSTVRNIRNLLCELKMKKSDEAFTLLGCYTAFGYRCFHTTIFKRQAVLMDPWKMVPTGYTETSVSTNLRRVTSLKSEGLNYAAAEVWNPAKRAT